MLARLISSPVSSSWGAEGRHQSIRSGLRLEPSSQAASWPRASSGPASFRPLRWGGSGMVRSVRLLIRPKDPQLPAIKRIRS